MSGIDPPALIDACYAAALDPGLWPAALDGVAAAVGARGGVIVSHDPARTPLTLHSEVLGEINVGYRDGWWRHDTRIARTGRLALRPGAIVVDEMYFPAEEKRRDPFVQEFFRPHGLDNLAACVDTDPLDGTILSISAPRDTARGAFDAAELERMRLLGPHATRAFKLTTILGEARGEAGDLASVLERMRTGIVALDGRGRVRAVNAAAETLVSGYLSLRAGREPEAAEPADRDRFGRFLAALLPEGAVLRQTSLLLRRKGSGRPLYVEALPLRASDPYRAMLGSREGGLLLLVRDLLAPSLRPVEPLLEPLGLTAAEARVAALVGRGAAPRDAAARLAVGESTVRSQLKAIYAKLGIRRQSELAVLVTRLDGV